MAGIKRAALLSPHVAFLTAVSPSDVAVGAPMEDDFAGTVYIYHGDAQGIVPQYSMVSDGRGHDDCVCVWYVSVLCVYEGCVHVCVCK